MDVGLLRLVSRFSPLVRGELTCTIDLSSCRLLTSHERRDRADLSEFDVEKGS